MYLREPRPGTRAIGDMYLSQPRGSTRRFAMGDGPITSPDQDPVTGEIQMPDDYVGKPFDSASNEVVATVGPIITGVTGALTSTADWLKNALSSSPTPTTTTMPDGSVATSVAAAGQGPNLLVLVALGGVGYAAYRHFQKNKKKRKR